MKLEMDEKSNIAVLVSTICLTVLVISWMIYKYNALVYEKGYISVQMQGTTQVMWTKGAE